MPQLANRLADVGQREVRPLLREALRDRRRPAPRQLLERAHVEVTVVKVALELRHLPREEAAILTDAVATHRRDARLHERGQKFQGAALGLDRDSAIVAKLFDERDEAVKALLQMAIAACRKRGKYVGICGQGPSDHADFARWLAEQGIESMSLNPDTVVETWLLLAGDKP